MSNEQAKQVLQQGIAAARAGNKTEARQLLQEAVKRDPKSETAWLWLSSVAKDNNEAIFCLKQLLAINPNNDMATKKLKDLGVSATPTAAAQTSAAVPMVDDQRLNASMSQLDPILSRYRPVPTASMPFEWMKKKRGRVGDSSAMMLRGGIIGGVLLVILLVGGGVTIALHNAGVGVVVFNSPTPFPTDVPTITATPGSTNTPSPQPRGSLTPTPTLPANVQAGLAEYRDPTAVYPIVSGRAVLNALQLTNAGKLTEAFEVLDKERLALETLKGRDYDTVIYYMVQNYIQRKNLERAQVLLTENTSDTPVYHAAVGALAYARRNFDTALTELNEALSGDPELVQSALLVADINAANGDYTEAIRVLNKALESKETASNVLLIVKRGNVELAAGRVNEAAADAALALYVDPVEHSAFVLKCRALLAQAAAFSNSNERIQAYGNAVLAAKDFMFYYPSETIAWAMLGKARQGEGNIDEALNAYTQAIVVDKKSLAAQEVYLERGDLYLLQRRYQDAFNDFDQAIQIGETKDGRAGRLKALVGLKNYTAAVEDVNALLRTAPTDPNLLITKVDLLMRTRKTTQAAPILSDSFVSSLNGDNLALARLYRGILRFSGGNYDSALDDLTASLATNDSGMAHFYRAQVFEAMKEPEKAVADYQWVMFWDSVYHYDFTNTVKSRLNNLQASLPTATFTPSIVPTNTPRPTSTKVPTRTLIPSRTSVPSKTPLAPNTPVRTSTRAVTSPATRTPTSATVAPTRTRTAVVSVTRTATP